MGKERGIFRPHRIMGTSGADTELKTLDVQRTSNQTPFLSQEDSVVDI